MKDYKPIVYADGVSEINLEVLLETSYQDLPYLVDAGPCIYLITNEINDKIYVGQAKNFHRRFCSSGFSHRCQIPNDEDYLHRSIRLHGESNFKVEILEDNCKDLNRSEKYWIDHLGAFFKLGNGYNMTHGGESCDNLHTKEVYQTNRNNHGGRLAWNSEESALDRRLSSLYKYIYKYEQELQSKDLELSRENYLECTSASTPKRHIMRVLEVLDDLISHNYLQSSEIKLFEEFRDFGFD